MINLMIQKNLVGIYVILVILAARFLLRKIGNRLVYHLWIVAFVSLLLPVNLLQGSFSLIPKEITRIEIQETAQKIESPQETPGVQVIRPSWEEIAGEETVSMDASASGLIKREDIALYIWGMGVFALFAFEFWQYRKMRQMIQRAVLIEEDAALRIRRMKGISAPFLFGIRKPYIYLPDFLEKEEQEYIICHEDYHRRKGDHLMKWAALCISILYWYNPIIWLGFYFFCVDMELACDEGVIAKAGEEIKKSYASSLLKFGARQNQFVITSLTFGEPGMKKRIQNVLKYKRKSVFLTFLGVLCVLILAVGLLVKPSKEADSVQEDSSVTDLEELQGNNSHEELTADQKTGPELTMVDVVRMLDAGELLTYDYEACANAEILYDDQENVLNYDVKFELSFQERNYRFTVSYMKEDHSLHSIYLFSNENGMYSIYFDGGIQGIKKSTVEELEEYLTTTKFVSDYISAIDLPTNYMMSSWRAELAYSSGVLILPQAYEVYESELFAPHEWYHSGFFSVIDSDLWSQMRWEWTDGKLLPATALLRDNHTSGEMIEAVEGLEKQACIFLVTHDLYTAAGSMALEEQGIDMSKVELTSEYWYIIMGSKEDEMGYCLALTTKDFSKEEAIEIAKSIHFVD